MLGSQESAWAVYASIFLFLALTLVFRCRNNLLLIPFVIFAFITSVGSICLLSVHYNNQQTQFNQYFWQSKSLALSILPLSAILIFVGIMEAQLIYIKQLSKALYMRSNNSYRNSPTLYVSDPEHGRSSIVEKESNNENPSSFRCLPWNYWASTVLAALYAITTVATAIVQTSSEGKSRHVATCVSLLAAFSFLNTLIVWYSCRSVRAHTRMIRHNKREVLFLRLASIFFSFAMVGIMILAWVYNSAIENIGGVSSISWIVLESFLVYLPLVVILVMCIKIGKIQKMGRQYPLHEQQQKQSRAARHVQKQRQQQETVYSEKTLREDSPISVPPATYTGQ